MKTPSTTAVRAMACASFGLPALALALPSGYSYGALLLCGIGIAAWFHRPAWSTDQRALVMFALALTALAGVWVWDAIHTQPFKVNALDRPLKFALLWLALPAVIWCPPPLATLRWGVWLGAIGAAVIATWQLAIVGMDRAWGHTNAIQFGNLALLLAIWSAVWIPHGRTWQAGVGWLAALAGLFATLASESRGGWWVAMVLLPMAWLLLRHGTGHAANDADQPPPLSARARRIWMLLALSVSAGVLGTQAERLVERTQQAWHEASQHFQTGESTNSVGQRLAHWSLAWDMGAARPIAGWGEQGYQEEKARRVDAGLAPPVLLSFQHAHHEWLDMWAKHGLIGLLTLMAAYAVPGLIYTRVLLHHRTRPPQAQKAHVNRQLCAVCGLLLVVGYLGFGMTQVMFAHNSSIIMYVFMNLLWLGAMLAPIEATPPPTRPLPPAA